MSKHYLDKMRSSLLLVVFIAGCGHVISPELWETARKDLSLPMVRANPSAYVGDTVVWGGIILGTLDRPEGTVITVLETPLSVQGRPIGVQPRGRFVAEGLQHLDRKLYRSGRSITVAGEITGYKTEFRGEIVPVVSIKESHAWKTEEETNESRSFFDTTGRDWWWW